MGKPSIPTHSSGDTMKAVCFTSFGKTAGDLSLINPEAYDTSVLGYDVAGVVQEVGDDASKEYSVGDEVFVRLAGMKYGVSYVLRRCAYDMHVFAVCNAVSNNSFYVLLLLCLSRIKISYTNHS